MGLSQGSLVLPNLHLLDGSLEPGAGLLAGNHPLHPCVDLGVCLVVVADRLAEIALDQLLPHDERDVGVRALVAHQPRPVTAAAVLGL